MVVARRLQEAGFLTRWKHAPVAASVVVMRCGVPALAGVIVERTWYSHGQNQGF